MITMQKIKKSDNEVVKNGGPVRFNNRTISFINDEWYIDNKKYGSLSIITREFGYRIGTYQVGCFLQKNGYKFKRPFSIEECNNVNLNKVNKINNYEHSIKNENNLEFQIEKDLDSIIEEDTKEKEGAIKTAFSNHYERNINLRKKAILIHKTTCKVCGFNFKERYGQRGENFIEVHHLKPLCEVSSEHEVDPETDMTVLCSNCHRMIHRIKDRILNPEELKKLINR